MKLLDYMKQKGLDDAAFAVLVGAGATPLAVRKWKYRETNPRIPELVRIEEVTRGAVKARDFLPEEHSFRDSEIPSPSVEPQALSGERT